MRVNLIRLPVYLGRLRDVKQEAVWRGDCEPPCAYARVIVSSRKIEGCRKVADEIVEAEGKADAFACHVGDMKAIETLFQYVEDKHERELD